GRRCSRVWGWRLRTWPPVSAPWRTPPAWAWASGSEISDALSPWSERQGEGAPAAAGSGVGGRAEPVYQPDVSGPLVGSDCPPTSAFASLRRRNLPPSPPAQGDKGA